MPWRDTDIQIEGLAVAEFQKLFLDTWRKRKGQNLPTELLPRLEGRGKRPGRGVGQYPRGGQQAHLHYVCGGHYVCRELAPYDECLLFPPPGRKALADAAKRGVDVKIILAGMTDESLAQYAGESHYSHLLKAGVKLYKRRNALLHAKTLVIDGIWSTVGSTNMDF